LALHTNLEKSSFDDILFYLAAALRFQNARLSNFVDIVDEKEQTQFAAFHITLSIIRFISLFEEPTSLSLAGVKIL